MDTELLEAALAGLNQMRADIERKMAELSRELGGPSQVSVNGAISRKRSAASRQRMAAAQRKRWAATRRAQAAETRTATPAVEGKSAKAKKTGVKTSTVTAKAKQVLPKVKTGKKRTARLPAEKKGAEQAA